MSFFLKGPRRPRPFTYEPRYYDPARDEGLRRRMRLRSLSHRRRRSPAVVVFFVLLLAAACYVYLRLG